MHTDHTLFFQLLLLHVLCVMKANLLVAVWVFVSSRIRELLLSLKLAIPSRFNLGYQIGPPDMSWGSPVNNPQLEEIAKAFCGTENLGYLGYVGRGAFKETYKARSNTGVLLAVKVFRSGASNERSDREIDAMRRCSHPHIARIISVSTFDFAGTIHLVTTEEFMGGGTLTSRLNRTRILSVEEIRPLATRLVAAVTHIANLDLVHRDIKPDNLMFRDDQVTPVIVDFGLVRDLAAESLTATWLIRGPGTPYFAPAEQLLNEKSLIDWRSDQFALGVLLSIAATGRHPYQIDGDSMDATIERVSRRDEPSARFHDDVAKLSLGPIARMVMPWPIQRYRKPADLSAAWEAAVG